MVTFLSPAKNMKLAQTPGLDLTAPRFFSRTEKLVSLLSGLSPWQIESIMKVSPEIAARVFTYYQDYTMHTASAALLSYYGLAYQFLGAADFSPADFVYAQTRLRIFSALYGPLRPTDVIKPYRLDMQCRLRFEEKRLYLYRFWGDVFYRDVFSAGGPVINLASGEYAKTVIPFLKPGDRMITCAFLVRRRGQYICQPTAAKMARGSMARYIVRSRADHPEALLGFSQDGFAFSEALSTDERYIFLRE